ncbi:MAG: DUF1553 domain-containing protein [Planctomycetes bacterium]|nr:DUF1553 domain-containing protein [Planctomycetota bacterium]
MNRKSIFAGAVHLAILSIGQNSSWAQEVDFTREIQPILSDNCFLCHGPDISTRKAKMRLDIKEGALQERDGWAPVYPGNPEDSEIILRIFSEIENDVMPPPDSHLALTTEEKHLIYRWIEQGAPWAEHWAYVAPVQPELPVISDPTWPRNAIDNFVMAKLDNESLTPSPSANDQTLLRRLSLDLTGFAPTPAQRAQFLEAQNDNRWQQQIDRLLASPRYGERMAWPWLDAARYADSNGYQGDKDRTMWPWRDWVVRAFNQNLPFDQFTTWQLAGDLLDNPTQEQKLATAFLRNHMINGEGGRIAEENRVEYIFDQLETVGTTWMGLTMNCCRCHDHKFDPISQENYYQLFAFFNQTEVTGGGDNPNTAPVMELPGQEQLRRIQDLQRLLNTVEGQRAEVAQKLAAVRAEWQSMKPQQLKAEHQDLAILEDDSVLASGENPVKDIYRLQYRDRREPIAAIRLEAKMHESMTAGGLARSDSGNFVLTGFDAQLVTEGMEPQTVAIQFARASVEQNGYGVSGALDGDPQSGWAVWLGQPITSDQEAIFYLQQPIHLQPGQSLQLTLRHESAHKHHNLGRFKISFTSAVQPEELKWLSMNEQHGELENEMQSVRSAIPRVMVMQEQDQQRRTFLLQSGLYNQPKQEVSPGLPSALPALAMEDRVDRLALAQWLVSPENPLTSRVVMNRLWAQVFGVGLVKTMDNFGSQGERPTHPELLDWLALEFQRSGWDVKHMMRLMVDSATYRQSSDRSAEVQELDPDNRLLARGPRYRLPSWMIRDHALQASGLLVDKIGGPGNYPYQPAGVWQEFTFQTRTYPQGEGASLYRRSLYTFWRRIVAPTMFFDSATRQSCSVTERRTNTPLHALSTLNDTTYVEASRFLAQRILQKPHVDEVARIRDAFLLMLSRVPSASETELVKNSLQRLRQQFQAAPLEAEQLLQAGASARDQNIDAIELAAWTSMALALFNLDETLTKE